MNFGVNPAPGVGVTPLQQLATAPQRVRTDEGTVEERPIDQLLMADVYNKLGSGQTQLAKPLWGIAVANVRPPDALGTQNRSPFSVVPRFQ